MLLTPEFDQISAVGGAELTGAGKQCLENAGSGKWRTKSQDLVT